MNNKSSTSRKYKPLTILIIIIAVAAAALLVSSYSGHVGSRAPLDEVLTETVVGGRLNADLITAGEHTLEYRARTLDGKTVSDQTTFDTGTSSDNPGQASP